MKKLFLAIFTVFAIANISYAGMGFDAGMVGQQNVIDMRWHEAETRAKNRSAIIQKEKAQEQQQQKKIDVPAMATTIKNIRFSGNQQIPAGDLARLVASYIGRQATDSNVSGIRRTIARYYQANGFYSAIVVPETSGLVDGVLVFDIKEGVKNSITVE